MFLSGLSLIINIIVELLAMILAVSVFVVSSVALFLRLAPTFGSRESPKDQPKIRNSPNFNGRTFVNLDHTQAATIKVPRSSETADNRVLRSLLRPPKGKNPSAPIDTVALQLHKKPLQSGEFVWLGHASVLFQLDGQTLLTDPVFHRAAPIPVIGKPFAMTHAPRAEDLPAIDGVLISHDHYDHLDYLAIKQLKDKVGHFYVPLGVAGHLKRWGVPADKISEYDWYDDVQIASLRLTFVPSRHFSGRRLLGHRTTLWGGWVVQSSDLKVYFSGDGGYSSEFARIGARFGGFDIAFIEDGAYNHNWREAHMMPEESAQAGIDVGAQVILPIHWGKFDLSTHQWTEPVKRLKQAINAHNQGLPTDQTDNAIRIATPKIGQVFDLDNLPEQAWWEEDE